MKRIRRFGVTILLIETLASVAGCLPMAQEPIGQPGVLPAAIECQVFYRPSIPNSLEGTTITLEEDHARETISFAEMTFQAQYTVDQGEGRSLSILVADAGTGEEIVRHLYQIDSAKGLSNQFVGGHGFTGLAYFYHPTSTAELQYFCQAR